MEAGISDPLRWKTLLVVGIASLMVVLDGTVVNIALPSIQVDLGISDVARQWVVTAYALTFGGLLLLGGRIGDFSGRKRTLIIGLLGFAGASAVCGFAQSGLMLILARGLAGACAALLAPVTLSLLAVSFVEVSERTRAFAVYSAISAGGGAVGLVLGGLLTQYVSWRWCLLINIPIAALAAGLAVPFVRESRASGRATYDIPGAITGTLGVLALVFGIAEAGTKGWTGTTTLLSLCVGLGLLAVFLVIESRSSYPLLPLRIILNRNRGGAYVASFLCGAALFSTFLFISYFLQSVLHYSPVSAGLAGLPFSAGVVASTVIANHFIAKIGPRRVTLIGFALAAVGAFGLTGISATSQYVPNVLPALLVMSLGMGMIFVPLTVIAVYRVSGDDTGVASAVVNMSQQIGGSIGVALLNTIAAATTASFAADSGVSVASPEALVVGFGRAFGWAAGLLAIGWVVWFVLVRVRLVDLIAAAQGQDSPQ